MKILHVWDVAGVACILAKYQRKLGHEAQVIARGEFDKLGFLKFYNAKALFVPEFIFTYQVYKMGKDFDVIHLHGLPEFTKNFKQMGKKVILHYHGSDAKKGKAYADKVIIANDNLRQFITGATVINNPVDRDHFRPKYNLRKKDALTFKLRYNDFAKFKEYTKDLYQKIEVIDREKNPIDYKDMSNFLNQYHYYIDIKFDKTYKDNPVRALSKTGLEALACGLKVINWQLVSLYKLPKENNPINVAKKTLNLYDSIK